MNAVYIRALGALIREANKEIDRAQVNEPPGEPILDAMQAVLWEYMGVFSVPPPHDFYCTGYHDTDAPSPGCLTVLP